jgi:hypothetical protein
MSRFAPLSPISLFSVGTGAACQYSMQGCFPARPRRALTVRKFAVVPLVALFAAGCSRTDVVMAPPPLSSVTTALPNGALSRQTAAERLVEIDRLLAAPVTGRADDSDQRALLRAERAALVASGQLPYRAQFATNHSQTVPGNPPLATITKRAPNGDLLNYAPVPAQTGRIVVAPNSQDRNLSPLEQMTPTERERYYKALRLQNTSRIDVNVRRHY